MLEHFLALSILKAPAGLKLYLNIIPIVFGLIFFIKNRRVNNLFLPLIILLALGVMRSLTLLDYVGVMRLGQVFCLIAFASMAKNWVNLDNLWRLSKYMLYFGLIFFLYEVVFTGPVSYKSVFGLKILRYNGPIGESNYSALLFAFSSLIFILRKDVIHFILSIGAIYLCVSRTAILMIIFFVLLLVFHKILKQKLKYILRIYGVILCTTPFLIWFAFKNISLEYLQILERFSSGRIFLFIPYVDMGFDQLFGIGYFNGWDHYEEYMQKFMHIDTGRDRQINEQHNIFIRVFSEFGVLLYPLWCWHILKIYWQEHQDLIPLVLFSTLLMAFSFLNGMHEFILYLSYAWIISANKIPNSNLRGLFNVKSR